MKTRDRFVTPYSPLGPLGLAGGDAGDPLEPMWVEAEANREKWGCESTCSSHLAFVLTHCSPRSNARSYGYFGHGGHDHDLVDLLEKPSSFE